jgi:hypothetical protein
MRSRPQTPATRPATPVPDDDRTSPPLPPPLRSSALVADRCLAGKWTSVADGSTGPDRLGGLMMATDFHLGIVLFGGAGPATGGNHPGLYQNDTWRWTGC